MDFLRQGYVVATHPADHSVDIVMTDNGQRLIGVPVLTPNGSGTSGTFNMPPVPDRGDKKWDISDRKEGEQIAYVGFTRGGPVVLGYQFPRNNQMTFEDGKRFVFRHPSDVTLTIEETGAMHLRHPSGLGISIGTPSDERNGDNSGNFNANFALKNNTGATTNISISMPGFSLKADKAGVKIKAKKIMLDGAVSTSEDLKVGGSVIPNTKVSM